MIREGIQKLVDGKNLSFKEAEEIMREIMSGRATPAQIGAFLVALRIKGESIEEITAFVTAMRDFCRKVELSTKDRVIDVCGTGGDRIKTFNISTTCAFVVAGAGVPVAKHGNRSVTSKSGSADVMEMLGYNLNSGPEIVKRTIESIGIGFMFAPVYHQAMKHAIGPRREIGIRTVFNILGPLANPANIKAQLLGVFSKEYVLPLAKVLEKLGAEEAMVVHGVDGLDEISTLGKTYIAWLKGGEIRTFIISPSDFNIRRASEIELSGSAPQEASEILFRILAGIDKGARRDIVLLNAAAGITVGGKADSLEDGIEIARESIDSGRAYGKLKELVKRSGGDLARIEELERKYGLS